MVKPQLFLLHYAGGSCYSFRFITYLLGSFDVIPLELPGRGKRIKEKLLTDFEIAAQDLSRQIKLLLSEDKFVIYGHSMGAYLALKVSILLENEGHKASCVIVSGNEGPGCSDGQFSYMLDEDAFKMKLKSLGGIPSEIIDNKEVFNFFEPVLRADFEIAERNNMENEMPGNAPIYAMMGDEEKNVEKILNWQKFTNSLFEFKIFKGNHFFIHEHPQYIAELIKEFYVKVTLLQFKYDKR